MRVSWKIACILCLASLASGAMAAGKGKAKPAEDEAKALSGMSIMGNSEAPKSLYLVPWKSSEIGAEANLTSGVLNDAMKPVDREVFMRELDFYEISKGD